MMLKEGITIIKEETMKKIVTIILIVLLPAVVFAQDFQNMSEQDMQKMMEQAQKMQACMEQVDQSQLAGLEQRSKEFEAELKALCDAGKRDKAQQKAMEYGKEMMDNPALKQMRKCGEMAEGMMTKMMPQMEIVEEDFDYSTKHVCDQ